MYINKKRERERERERERQREREKERERERQREREIEREREREIYIYICMGASQKSGMDRSAVIRTMDGESLRKVPDPYPFVRDTNCADTPTCYYLSSCYCCC